ncbi:MAG: NHL repeat-containing protein [Nitrospirae bacterium]|nr:NHL repeat-containing protein [Nitrospirota bacterium]
MQKTFIRILVAITVFLLPLKAFSAEAVRLMPVMSVYSDDKGEGLKLPEGVACTDRSLFIVADTGNGRLLRYALENNALKTAGTEIKLPQMTSPVRVNMNSKGEILALDSRQRRIVHISPEGEFKGYVEPASLPALSQYVPNGFDIDANDNIYILDILSERVLVLNSAGEYQKQIDLPKDHGFFSDIAVDFRGNILLVDSVKAMVYSNVKDRENFSPLTEGLKEKMRFPANLTTDRRGRIYLTDRNGSQIIVLSQEGNFLGRLSGMGWKEGLLNYPSQICINSEFVFVADTNNSRVQIFSLVK